MESIIMEEVSKLVKVLELSKDDYSDNNNNNNTDEKEAVSILKFTKVFKI